MIHALSRAPTVSCLATVGWLLLLFGSGMPASAQISPTHSGTTAALDAVSMGPYTLVAATCGVGGVQGWDNIYSCRGTIGQAIPGGCWGGPYGTVYGGFWSCLLLTGYLPVPVALTSFTANRVGREVLLVWGVTEDADLLGFHVYRQVNDGPLEQLTTTALIALGEYQYRDRSAPDGPVRYWLAEIGRTGVVTWFGPVGVPAATLLPTALVLNSPIPNPFVSRTMIAFTLPEDEWVCGEVFDVRGRQVATLVDERRAAGPQVVEWNGRGQDGARLAAGVYLLKLTAGREVRLHKLIIAK